MKNKMYVFQFSRNTSILVYAEDKIQAIIKMQKEYPRLFDDDFTIATIDITIE